MDNKKNPVSVFIFILIAFFVFTAFMVDEPISTLCAFVALQLQSGRLINDFFAVAGLGGTLLNSAAVGLLGWLLVRLTKTSFSGPTFAALMTMMGFAFFGKTPANILPIILGVILSAKFAGKSAGNYLLIALFGSALGPLISVVRFWADY